MVLFRRCRRCRCRCCHCGFLLLYCVLLALGPFHIYGSSSFRIVHHITNRSFINSFNAKWNEYKLLCEIYIHSIKWKMVTRCVCMYGVYLVQHVRNKTWFANRRMYEKPWMRCDGISWHVVWRNNRMCHCIGDGRTIQFIWIRKHSHDDLSVESNRKKCSKVLDL